MKPLYRNFIVAVIAVSLLHACGFRLRGSSELPDSIKYAVIEGVAKYSDVGLAIRQQLESAGAKVLPTPDVDTIHFVVLQDNYSKRVLSVSASGSVNEYELSYLFSIRVSDAKGKILVAERQISLNRNYIYDLNNALAKSDEENSIRIQMVSLAVRQAMRRISIKLKQLSDAEAGLNSSTTQKSANDIPAGSLTPKNIDSK